MAMAQGFTEEQVKSTLEDVSGSPLLDAKAKQLLQYAEKATRHAYKITEEDVQRLHEVGRSDEEILEATLVVALFSFMDRVADALGVQVENFVGMMKSMK
jgi:alkylhydroperoxidase family enzyme